MPSARQFTSGELTPYVNALFKLHKILEAADFYGNVVNRATLEDTDSDESMDTDHAPSISSTLHHNQCRPLMDEIRFHRQMLFLDPVEYHKKLPQRIF